MIDAKVENDGESRTNTQEGLLLNKVRYKYVSNHNH